MRTENTGRDQLFFQFKLSFHSLRSKQFVLGELTPRGLSCNTAGEGRKPPEATLPLHSLAAAESSSRNRQEVPEPGAFPGRAVLHMRVTDHSYDTIQTWHVYA